MTILRTAVLVLTTLLLAEAAHAQARLVVVNQSERDMTIKVMRVVGDQDVLYATSSAEPSGTQTIYFSESGLYFLKTMATLAGRASIFQKGSSFQVVNDRTGYSVLTMTFSIVESVVPQVLGGRQISREEFDRDRPLR